MTMNTTKRTTPRTALRRGIVRELRAEVRAVLLAHEDGLTTAELVKKLKGSPTLEQYTDHIKAVDRACHSMDDVYIDRHALRSGAAVRTSVADDIKE